MYTSLEPEVDIHSGIEEEHNVENGQSSTRDPANESPQSFCDKTCHVSGHSYQANEGLPKKV